MKIEEILKEYFKNEQIKYKDTSKGCDNNVYIVKLNNKPVTVKIPRKPKNTRPKAHSTFHLEWFGIQCIFVGIKAPKTIHCQEEFIVEDCIGELDISDILNIDKNLLFQFTEN